MNAQAAKFSHQARKRFGQNFLVDENIIDNIVSAISPQSHQNLVEIGPGKGALTLPLLQQCENLTVVEIDRDLAAHLEQWQHQYPKLTIIQQDMLKVDLAALAQNQSMRVVGNLPYNISTPLIFHLLQFRHLIHDMHFMLQKEVVERLSATPNSKNYGRLSVMVQYCAAVDNLFTVPPECFSPAPKVTSAVVRLTPHSTLPFKAKDEKLFSQLVAACFQARRKTLRNSLRKFCSDAMMASLPVDSSLRPENLSVEDFVVISNAIEANNSTHATR